MNGGSGGDYVAIYPRTLALLALQREEIETQTHGLDE